MTPVISIIVPVYNVAKYLHETLENITAQQRFNDCELILINDGSTDNSLDIIRDCERKFENVHVINKCNEGVSVTRNKGIEKLLANTSILWMRTICSILKLSQLS